MARKSHSTLFKITDSAVACVHKSLVIPLDETGYSVSSLSASNVTDTIRLQWLVEGRCDGIILSRSSLDRLSKKSDKICDFGSCLKILW